MRKLVVQGKKLMGFTVSPVRPLLVMLSLILLSACANPLGIRPAPELLDAIDFEFTQGIPVEQPLEAIRTEGLTKDEINTAQVYKANYRAVLNVMSLNAYRTRFGTAFPNSGQGSGFIIKADGAVVTNYHVVQGAQQLIVTLYDGSRYPAKIVGFDVEMDLAIIRFDPLGRQLTTIKFGDSSLLQVGEKAFAFGNPFGFEGTLTTGIVSALKRPIQIESGFILSDLVQTDAAINPGNSGGPLLNSRGELIGVNTLIISPSAGSSGIGLAISSNTVKRIVTQLLDSGRVNRGWLDIEGIALDARLARAAGISTKEGLLITRIIPGGNADLAGLKDGSTGRHIRYGMNKIPVDGDIIAAFNGNKITGIAEFFSLLEMTQPNEVVTLSIARNGKTQTIQLSLSERPK
jgi:S1-C subfamily serine protease